MNKHADRQNYTDINGQTILNIVISLQYNM